MFVTNDIRYIGVNDHNIDLFEGQYTVPNGMAYNSYVILDDKIAVMDTVDRNFRDEWLKNLAGALGGRKPDYLVVQHMEPDHSANIVSFMDRYPEAVIVSSNAAFGMMKCYFGTDFAERRIVVGEGSTLALGRHTLSFVAAPMVHWPEVIVTYDSADKVLFSADGFGKFGALDADEDWACEARRYYIGIVGKFGANVQTLLKKAAKLDIRIICPLHGPVLSEDLGYYINLYDIWSSYRVESEGAGNMVTLLIQSELGLEDFNTAEDIKKYSLAKVESLFHIRHEDGTVQFFEKPLDPNVFAKVVLVKEEGELVPIEGQDSMEKIKMVRTNAKKKVFVTNAIRSLAKVSPTGNVRDIEFVVLVGGSALDFEVPTLVTDALSQYNIVAGRGNIRGCEGPRNAVATGLAMSCADV